MYYAIIGDIINSKKINNRLATQEKLKHYLEIINKEYQDDIAANFIITLGDEFQGLLKTSTHLFTILNKIEIVMRPLRIRFGIGVGDILTKIDNKMSIGSDGPAWWRARDMISDLKKNQTGLKLISNIKIAGIDDQNILDLLNINLSFCYSVKSNWTKEQREVNDYITLHYGLTDHFIQKRVAEEMGLSPVNVNKKLKLSLFYDLVYAQNTIMKILENER
ncbi:DNA-binding protein [Mycoplasmatota bacterium]|nr:DNA-binding protein [Mycoplasmatota bacterium]